MITRECENRIKDAVDIYDIVSLFVKLRKSGSNYMGCCPFHSERTPSFSVSKTKNIFKCFSCGKGGDAFTFLMEHENMTYNEALEYIANYYHIHVTYDHKERTQDEIEQSKKKESMLIALQKVQQFYEQQFLADNPEASKARDYAYGRWPNTVEIRKDKKGEDVEIVTDNCKALGIGFAPADPSLFFEFIKREGLSIDVLVELGLLKASDFDDNLYPAFRQRLTIPIRDRWSKVIGFTARYLGTETDKAKYINSTDSPVFKKGEVLFGHNVARRCVDKTKEFIVVEGAPDVMRLQLVGLNQAVAPLGTSLTDQQLDLLHRDCGVLRFIPDSDPLKEGEQFSAGENAVMRNGRRAMEKGFEVYVREIPRTEEDVINAVKHDPDEYITDSSVYEELDDVPFVVWLAEKKFRDIKGEDKRRAVVREIAELFVYITDKELRDYCREELTKIYSKPQIWKKAINAVVQKALEAEAEKLTEDFSDKEKAQLHKHGIIIRNNMYFTPSKDGQGMDRLSNFILRPKFHVKHKDNSLRTFRIINEYGIEESLELNTKTFGSVSSFQQAIEGLGAFIWLAKQEQLNKVKEYLFSLMESAENIVELGWHQDGKFFAFADGIHTGQVFIPIDEMGIVHFNDKTYYLPAFSSINIDDPSAFKFERQFIFRHSNADTLYQFVDRLGKVFGDGGKIGFAWVLACLFRDHIHKVKSWFPMLNIFGIRGSGKTALATSLASFFYVINNDPEKLQGSSVPAMSYMMSHARNAVIVLDEYSNLLPAYKIDMLKGIWGGNTRSTMNSGESGGGIKASPVYSGVIFCGQHQPSSDPALFSRCVHLAYSRTSFSLEEAAVFEELKRAAKQGNAHLAMEIMQHRDMFVEQFESTFALVRNEVNARIGKEMITSRLLDNWLCVLTSFRVLETVIKVPFSYADLFEICIRGIRYQHSQSEKTSETADFWSLLNSMHMVGKAIDKTHYVIKYLTTFQSEGSTKVETFGHTTPLLFLNWDAVKPLISQRGFANLMKMDAGALENYLRTSPFYLGIKQQRFTVLTTQGYPDMTVEGGAPGFKAVKKVRVSRPRALVFDYESLKAATNIDLETVVVPDEETDHDASEAADQKPASPPPPKDNTLFNSNNDELPF